MALRPTLLGGLPLSGLVQLPCCFPSANHCSPLAKRLHNVGYTPIPRWVSYSTLDLGRLCKGFIDQAPVWISDESAPICKLLSLGEEGTEHLPDGSFISLLGGRHHFLDRSVINPAIEDDLHSYILHKGIAIL